MPLARDKLRNYADYRRFCRYLELFIKPVTVRSSLVFFPPDRTVNALHLFRLKPLSQQHLADPFRYADNPVIYSIFKAGKGWPFAIVNPSGENCRGLLPMGAESGPQIGATPAVHVHKVRFVGPYQTGKPQRKEQIQLTVHRNGLYYAERGGNPGDFAPPGAEQHVLNVLLRQSLQQIADLESPAIEMASGFKMQNFHG